MTNKLGWYDEGQREYVVTLANDDWTPRPWSNIITNKEFGTLVTCSGASFTWFLNSALFRLTPWVNDPVVESSGELIYLSDETTSEVWSPLPLPIREKSAYEIRHGLGYTTFLHTSHQLVQKVKIFVHPQKPIKYVEITLTNLAKVPRKISLSYYCQWVLGDFAQNTNRQLWVGCKSPDKTAVLAKVLGNDFRSEYTAYLTCDGDLHLATDRGVFFGHKPSNDPCGVVKRILNILPGQEVTVTFSLGVTKEIKDISRNYSKKAFIDGQDFWQKITKTVSVDCPDQDLNNLFNDRLVYQTLSSRLWGRVGMYQPGGAYGFRDQLQDSLALVWTEPALTRDQILKAARQQQFSGEVSQWWHPPENFGVLSSSSDTHLWLVYCACKYWQITGDDTIFAEKIPYLNDQSNREGTLYEHCLISIERTLALIGPKGLPLILSGDWNDSLDNVGPNKQGESVWLGLFLSYILENFSKVGEKDFSPIAHHQAELIEELAWKDDQFVRAFADDGQVLGFTDSIVQSWAVICNLVNKDLAKKAMDTVLTKLVDRENGLVKLLAPSIPANTTPYLGYIQQYPQGMRENGGFYCHAAVWVAWALALEGRGDQALEIIDMINPFKRNEKYMVEPYVLSSDINACEPFAGRGGWSWYTGSAATLYFILMEEIFGLKLRKDILSIDPCIPKNWDKFSIRFKNYQINIANPNKVNRGVKEVFLDGVKQSNNQIPFFDDANSHLVVVNMG